MIKEKGKAFPKKFPDCTLFTSAGKTLIIRLNVESQDSIYYKVYLLDDLNIVFQSEYLIVAFWSVMFCCFLIQPINQSTFILFILIQYYFWFSDHDFTFVELTRPRLDPLVKLCIHITGSHVCFHPEASFPTLSQFPVLFSVLSSPCKGVKAPRIWTNDNNKKK